MEYKNNIVDEIDIRVIYEILFTKKLLIFFFTLSVSIISLIIAMNTPDRFKSESIMMPIEAESTYGSSLSGLSAFASTAGINLPQSNNNRSLEALKRIESYQFFSKYILPNIKPEDLIAAKGWNINTNEIIYDKKKFIKEKNYWVTKKTPLKTQIPSSQDAYSEFMKILNLSHDKKTPFITISIEHYSPYIAKEWLDLIINQIDIQMKTIDRKKALESIKDYEERLANTSLSGVKQILFSLIGKQEQILMLSNSSTGYVFQLIDEPYVPEKKFSPNRFIIVFTGTFFGLILSIFIALTSHFLRNKKELIAG